MYKTDVIGVFLTFENKQEAINKTVRVLGE